MGRIYSTMVDTVLNILAWAVIVICCLGVLVAIGLMLAYDPIAVGVGIGIFLCIGLFVWAIGRII